MVPRERLRRPSDNAERPHTYNNFVGDDETFERRVDVPLCMTHDGAGFVLHDELVRVYADDEVHFGEGELGLSQLECMSIFLARINIIDMNFNPGHEAPVE